jgi:hypothetical protein
MQALPFLESQECGCLRTLAVLVVHDSGGTREPLGPAGLGALVLCQCPAGQGGGPRDLIFIFVL